ncbi:MAG: hypothetical protein GIKADHBN_01009 [Phycisphaerales bacterium]|nr:hypothetical protein [Phycisphaerales bacterium]MCK6476395.1 PrsW family glutamic-type intramembrane protease [Phycisphaerales bacterium]
MLVATVLLYIGLAGCSILAIAMVLQYDLHKREPLGIVLTSIAMGAAAMYACMAWQRAFVEANALEIAYTDIQRWALLAGVTEETTKLVVVVAVAVFFRRDFDEPIDGLIYGSMAGLGAGIMESVYVQGAPEFLTTLPKEEPIRLLGHLVMGGIGGFGIGLVATISWGHLVTALVCFLAAVSLHVTWDVLAYRMADEYGPGGQPPMRDTALSIGLMLGGFSFFKLLVACCPRCLTKDTRAPKPASSPDQISIGSTPSK